MGQLGNGTTTDNYVPQQIGTDTWKLVSCEGSAEGYPFCIALKTDDTLWSWGNNALGQLGNGSVVSVSAPYQIGDAADWAFCSVGAAFTSALKTDHSLEMWGDNENGQFGNGTYNYTPYTSPQHISCDFLSVTEYNRPQVSIYPNPAATTLHIYTKGTNVTGIVITDLTGKIVREQKMEAAINIESLESGVYFVTLVSDSAMFTQKIIKQ